MKLIKKAQNVRFRNKIAIKLLSYFGVSLFLFSVVVGSIFGYIYIQNTVAMHKKNLEERAYKISETLSKIWFEDEIRNEKSPDKICMQTEREDLKILKETEINFHIGKMLKLWEI